MSIDFAWVLLLGLLAGTVGGVIGFGTSIMLMPALVLVFGPREAVPIMAVASVMANASRVAVWWREVDWRCALAYSATAAPAAALGAATLLRLPVGVIEAVLGLFFVAMVPLRRWMARQGWRLGLPQMALVGGVVGFVTGAATLPPRRRNPTPPALSRVRERWGLGGEGDWQNLQGHAWRSPFDDLGPR